MSLFLADHARVHSREVAPAEGMNLEDVTCARLSDDQLRQAPPGHNAIAWYLWHMARTEDIAINAVLRGDDDLFSRDGWQSRLGVQIRDIGAGMTETEAAAFGHEVDLVALRQYRAAVGRATRAWAAGVDPTLLSSIVPGAGEHTDAAGAFRPEAIWLRSFWQEKTGAWFLSWVTLGHSYMHLADAGHVAALLGRRGP